jgi:drug/metabolite transporter (DMT)-like permease
MLACGAVYDVIAVTRGAKLPSEADGWVALAGVALICTVVAVATFFAALSRLGPADTAVLSTVEPVISVGVAAAVLGERLGGLQVAGGVLVLVAVAALARLDPTAQRDEADVPA